MTSTDFNSQQWQPVRLPSAGESRSADFPPLDTFISREMKAMIGWCEANCAGSWRHEADSNDETVFWFQSDADARRFAMVWFPFKCV